MRKRVFTLITNILLIIMSTFTLVNCNNAPDTSQTQEGAYTIRFDCAGGKIEGGEEITYKEGDTLVFPIPEKHGFIFLGWESGNVIVEEEKWLENKKDVTLTATYSKIVFQAQYETTTTVKGKQVQVSIGGKETTTFTVKHGEKITDLPNAQILNNSSMTYVFKGWKAVGKSGQEIDVSTVVFDEDVFDYTKTVYITPNVIEVPQTDYYE